MREGAAISEPTAGAGPKLVFRGAPRRWTMVHHEDERGTWATRGRQVLHADPEGGSWREIARFPFGGYRELGARPRLASRLLRAEKCNVFPTRAGKLLGIRGGVVYRVEEGGMVPLFQVQGNCIMNRSIAETEDGELYFGEYFMNPQNRAIRVWRVDRELTRGEVAYRFEKPKLRHVHAIYVDPHRPGRLWLTTGDFAGQCWLAYTDDRFRTLELLGDGGQMWRAVGLVFQPERICWLTDSELETNRAVAYDRASRRISLHGTRPAASWYVAELSDGGYLATTAVEPGPSVRASSCHLLHSRDGLAWSEVGAFPKDVWPMPWFGSGSLSLPSGRFSSAGFWISGEGVRGLEGISRRAALVEGS